MQYPSRLSTRINGHNGIFEEWQRQRLVKVPIVEVAGLFKAYDFHLVESLDTPLVEMSVLPLIFKLG